jgi:hypothetical protein
MPNTNENILVQYRDSFDHKVHGTQDFETLPLQELVEKQMCRSDYYSGEIETAKEYITTLQNTVSILLEVLYADKKLNGNQLCKILGLAKGSIKRIALEEIK